MNKTKSTIIGIIIVGLALFTASGFTISWQHQDALGEQKGRGQQQQQQTNSSNATNNVTNNINNNKAIVMAFTKAFNDHNPKELDSVVAKNIIEHRQGVQSGINSTKQFLNSLITAFPDFHTKIEHILGEGDKVIVFTNTTGTHKGPFMFAPGIPPTGKHIWFRTADLYRIANNKIAEHWDVVEYLNMLQDLGAIKFNAPPPSAPSTPNK